MGRAAGSSNLPNSSKRKTTVRWTVVFLFLPRSGPNFSLRPKAALFPFPAGRAPSPPFSFCRKKRTGRWSGPRDKTPWAPRLNVLHEARMGPWTPISSVNRPAKASLNIKRSERRDCFCSTTCFREAALTEQAEPGIQSLSRPAAASSLYTREPLRGPSHPARWGSRGPSSSSSGHSSSVPPGAFLLDRQAARSLFPGEKRTGGRRRFPLGKKEARPPGAKKS